MTEADNGDVLAEMVEGHVRLELIEAQLAYVNRVQAEVDAAVAAGELPEVMVGLLDDLECHDDDDAEAITFSYSAALSRLGVELDRQRRDQRQRLQDLVNEQ